MVECAEGGATVQSRLILSSRRSSLLRSVGLGGGNTLGRTMIAASDKRWIQKNMCLRYQPVKTSIQQHQHNNTNKNIDTNKQSSTELFQWELPWELIWLFAWHECAPATFWWRTVSNQFLAVNQRRAFHWNARLDNSLYPPSIGLLLFIEYSTTRLTARI